MKKALLIVLALILSIPASADLRPREYHEAGDFVYYYKDGYEEGENGEYITIPDERVVISGLTEAGQEKEEIVIPAEIDGKRVYHVEPYNFLSDNLKRLILPDNNLILGVFGRNVPVGWFKLPNLEYINLDTHVSVESGALARCPKLHTVSSDGKNIINAGLGSGALSNTAIEEVTYNDLISSDIFENCKNLRTVHFNTSLEALLEVAKRYHNIKDDETLNYIARDYFNQELPKELFKDCTALDYICLDNNVFGAHGRTFHGCKNLRTLVIPVPDFEFRCGAYVVDNRYSSHYEEYCAIDGVAPDNERTKNPYCVFKDNYKLTVFCVDGTPAAEYLKKHGIHYIPSIIPRGGQSTVVAHALQNAAVYINGAAIPAYTLNGSVYVSESSLKPLGFNMDWDGEARTTTITKPENVQWSVKLGANLEPDTVDIVSSDIKFMLDGFPIPALNIGNGESIIDVNALAEAVLY